MKILVSKEFLDTLFEFQSRVLMGQVLKRFELFQDDKETLKKELRELLPEWCRSLKYHILSFDSGAQTFEFEFKRPEAKKS